MKSSLELLTVLIFPQLTLWKYIVMVMVAVPGY